MENGTHVVLKARRLTRTDRLYTTATGPTEFVRPDALTDAQLRTVMKRVGAPDVISARAQYTTLHDHLHVPAVRRELERIHAKFIALRLKESQI